MNPFVSAAANPTCTSDPDAAYLAYGITSDCLRAWLQAGRLVVNDQYQVAAQDLPGGAVHLAVIRHDGATIPWDDLQEIKNLLVGPECEAIELYPAETRRHEAARHRHLWVQRSTTFRFPLGFARVHRLGINPVKGSVDFRG